LKTQWRDLFAPLVVLITAAKLFKVKADVYHGEEKTGFR
jgi:hypothetical protein